MEYLEAVAWLDSHLNHEKFQGGVVAGQVAGLSLEPMRRLMSLLGDPQSELRSIHITGTNGKGAVAEAVGLLLRAHGLSVGTYSSPHIRSLNERISRDGQPIGDEDLAEVLSAIALIEDLAGEALSWFEVMTAAAFRWFAEAPVDVAVIEVGLLGRHDATNVIDADVSVVTSIQGDHTDFAPGWQTAVASEKAGILRPDGTAVIGEMGDEIAAVFEAEGPRELVRYGADIEVVSDDIAVGGHLVTIRVGETTYEEVFLPVHGPHQVRNTAVAIAVVQSFFDRPLDVDVVREALGELSLPGRFEVVNRAPLVVIDGAHNFDAITAAAATLDAEFTPVGRRIVVVGMLGGREVARTADAVVGFRPDLVITTTLAPPRGVRAAVINAAFMERRVATQIVEDPLEAVRKALSMADDEDVVVITGSFRIIDPAHEAVGWFVAKG